MSGVATFGQKLMVHVVRAEGLQHMNHFTGDHPYVAVEVKHEESHHKKTSVQTKPFAVGDTLNPYWDEVLELEPWNPGEALEFIIYDKGLLGSKVEGKVLLPSETFYPERFSGMLNISGLPHAKLQVVVQSLSSGVVVGQTPAVASDFQMPTPVTYQAPASTYAIGAATDQPPTTYASQAAPAGSVTYQAPPVYAAAAPTYSTTAPMYMTQSAPTYAEAGAVTYAAPAVAPQAVTYETSTPTYVPGMITYGTPTPAATTAVAPQAVTYEAPTPTYVPGVVTYGTPTAAGTTAVAPQAVAYEAPTPTYVPGVVTYGTPTPAATTTYQAGSAPTIISAPTSYAGVSSQVAQPQGSYGVVQAPMAYGAQQLQAGQMYGGVAMGPQKLAVSILQAHGLQHMNNFTGDHPYVTCEVKHLDHHARTTRIETQKVTEGDTLNPFWGETHHIEPWHMGESLEFTVYDKGLLGSKTEGNVTLTPDLFYPNGFSGMVQISGLPHALLHIIVRAMGPASQSAAEGRTAGEAMDMTDTAATPMQQNLIAEAPVISTKGKCKKLKKGKKQKGCC